jgi:hypothetical protein
MQGISRWPVGTAAIEEDGEGQDAAFSAGRTAVRRAISPGGKRSLTVTRGHPPRRSGHVTGPDGTGFQAASAGSIPRHPLHGKTQTSPALHGSFVIL